MADSDREPGRPQQSPTWEKVIFATLMAFCVWLLLSGGIEWVIGERRVFSARRLSRPVLAMVGLAALRWIISPGWRGCVAAWTSRQIDLLRAYRKVGKRAPWQLSLVVVGVPVFVVYVLNDRLPTGGDAVAIRQTAASLVLEHNLDIDEYVDPHDPPYQAVAIDGHWYSAFPPAGGLLFLSPLVQVAQWINPTFSEASVVRLEKLSASLVSAGACAAMFLALVRVVRPALAWWVAMLLGLGTGLWTTGSHLLSQHGPVCLLVAVMLWLEMVCRSAGRGAVAAGICAGLAVVIRPTAAIWAVCYAMLLLLRRRRDFVLLVVAALVAAAPMAACYWVIYGHPVGAYRSKLVDHQWSSELWQTVPANLVSPARGLFVWIPLAVLSVGALRPAGRRGLPPGLAVSVGVWLVLHLAVVSKYTHWWGGHSYGPRFLIDIMPGVVLLMAPTFARLWESGRRVRCCLLLLIAWSVFTQVVGAFGNALDWVWDPVNVDQAPERIWDLSDPPFFYDFRQAGPMPGPVPQESRSV